MVGVTPQWLRHWLLPVQNDVPALYPDRHFYRQVAYFQMAFYTCWIMYDETACNYIWYVAENYICYEGQMTDKCRRFTTYDAVIDAVAASGVVPWKTMLYMEN